MKGKPSRPVLRGPGGRKVAWLLGSYGSLGRIAFKDLDAWEEHAETLPQVLENYLTEAHCDSPGTGCAMGALLGDMSHASKSAKTVYTARVKRSLVFTAGLLPSEENADNGAAYCSSSAVCWGRSISLEPSRTRSYRAKFSTKSASSSSI